jgi:hypothetical protein
MSSQSNRRLRRPVHATGVPQPEAESGEETGAKVAELRQTA